MTMNRKKKINQILKTKQKKINAKLHKSNKPRYISKADREKLAMQPHDPTLESTVDVIEAQNVTPSISQ